MNGGLMNSNFEQKRQNQVSGALFRRLLALKDMTMPELKQEWHRLFETPPPAFNRANLEARLAYRIQELSLGGLSNKTILRLRDLGERLDGGDVMVRKTRVDAGPAPGTQLIRDWQGTEQVVNVTCTGFEWNGRPYKSLSSVAFAITGTRWNGWVFFGLKRQERAK